MLECGDTENETVPCHHLIHYRVDTSPCSCTAGYDSNFEGGGTELEIFVKCVWEATLWRQKWTCKVRLQIYAAKLFLILNF